MYAATQRNRATVYLGHVLKFVAETLDGVERGRITMPDDAKALFNRVRDVLVRLL